MGTRTKQLQYVLRRYVSRSRTIYYEQSWLTSVSNKQKYVRVSTGLCFFLDCDKRSVTARRPIPSPPIKITSRITTVAHTGAWIYSASTMVFIICVVNSGWKDYDSDVCFWL